MTVLAQKGERTPLFTAQAVGAAVISAPVAVPRLHGEDGKSIAWDVDFAAAPAAAVINIEGALAIGGPWFVIDTHNGTADYARQVAALQNCLFIRGQMVSVTGGDTFSMGFVI